VCVHAHVCVDAHVSKSCHNAVLGFAECTSSLLTPCFPGSWMLPDDAWFNSIAFHWRCIDLLKLAFLIIEKNEQAYFSSLKLSMCHRAHPRPLGSSIHSFQTYLCNNKHGFLWMFSALTSDHWNLTNAHALYAQNKFLFKFFPYSRPSLDYHALSKWHARHVPAKSGHCQHIEAPRKLGS
jgi:hypothetical protein